MTTICMRQEEVIQAVRSGHWPQGCDPELRNHVATCARCAEEVRILSAFAAVRESSMLTLSPQSPGLLWWKAQLRKRREAMEQIKRPGSALPITTIVASILLLAAVLSTMWTQIEWSQLLAIVSPSAWNIWILVPAAIVLCVLAIVAVVVGSGLAEERH